MIKKSLKEPVDEELDGFRVAITRSLYPYTLNTDEQKQITQNDASQFLLTHLPQVTGYVD